jgi:hypothetical protein
VGKDIATIFLPHLLFSNLHSSYPLQFEKMFGKASDVAQFWKNVEAVKDERLPGHPICLDKRTGLVKRHVVNAECTIPLFTHADGNLISFSRNLIPRSPASSRHGQNGA